jgi:hypothetical protein
MLITQIEGSIAYYVITTIFCSGFPSFGNSFFSHPMFLIFPFCIDNWEACLTGKLRCNNAVFQLSMDKLIFFH